MIRISDLVTMFRLAVLVLGVCATATRAAAAIDMSGVYEAIQFPCRYTFVQTGTHLEVTGPCTTAQKPLSATGTIDPATGVFSVAGVVTDRCTPLLLTGTADGEMFTATGTCNTTTFSVTATKCLNGMLDPGEECEDGNFVDGDCCSSRCRYEPSGSACGTDTNLCTSELCDGAGTCALSLSTAACDDGNACTVGDVCAAGTCVSGEPQPPGACAQTNACERTVVRALSSCIATAGARTMKCYRDNGAACPPDDRWIARALAKVADRIGARCPDAETVQTIGYGAEATPAALIARVQEMCTGEVASIAARTFGGPHAAVLSDADARTARCLAMASSTAVKLVRREAKLRAACIARAHGTGEPCDVAGTNAEIAAAEALATDTVATSCPDLETAIGLDPAMYVTRAASQARCVTAAAHGNTGPLPLDCGPRGAVEVPRRDTWTKVVLDEATYGSRCGDGSPYVFWLRLPPAGSPSRNVVVNLQGGGLCFGEADCAAKATDLFAFTATNNRQPDFGILSTRAAENPFSDWTMVFLPYCTQDLHTGGGTTEVFPSITVHRFGAINVRAALRYVRDVLWQDLAETEPEGYRPDRLTVLFAGMSVGGFGADFNYPYVLDDLRWAHTTAVPDSGVAVDSAFLRAAAPSLQSAWGARAYQPPYCLDPTCAVGTVSQAASAPRLKAVPEQQILNVSNQVDDVAATTSFFPSMIEFVNGARTAYCATRGLNGIRYWLAAESTPLHVFISRNGFLPSVTAGGETLATFLTEAMAHPDAVTDHVDEGTLVTDYPGVNPIGCLE